MGGCYSTSSHQALTSPKHKKPKNSSLKCNSKTPGNTALTNGKRAPGESDYAADKNDNCAEPLLSHPHISPESVVLLVDSSDGKQSKGVVSSDSGIESVGSPQEEAAPESPRLEFSLCQPCHQKLQRISLGSCHQCGNFQIDSSELSVLGSGETYCTCGPRMPGRQTVCRTHKPKGRNNPPHPPHRHSDIVGVVLKSNLKKQGCGRGDGKQVRMSWKSADSLDLRATMNTCMDRAKSEASEIFGDDVSFHAPLAQFDSVDCQLNQESTGKGSIVYPESRMSICSEILNLTDHICKCDFTASDASPARGTVSCTSTVVMKNSDSVEADSKCVQAISTGHVAASPLKLMPASSPLNVGHLQLEGRLEKEDDDDSGHGISKSEERSQSMSDSDLDTGEDSDRLLSPQSSPRRTDFTNFDVDWMEAADGSVCAVTVNGHQMVMMDAASYTQMLSDLALLREQLSHLTQVIQEEDRVEPLNLSLTLDD